MSKDVPADIGFTFEAVLEAVQDSGRGRWFLEEYRKRTGQADLARMTDAVNRIESRIEALTGNLTAAEDLAKVRHAINTARSEIERLTPPGEGLSAEGRLFAHLAELARKAMPQPGPEGAALPAGIEKTLRLVDTLDATLNSNVTAFPGSSARQGDRFFQQDAQLFEKPAAAPPIPAPAAPAPVTLQKPAVEKTPMGARLTITRTALSQSPDRPAEAVAEHGQAENALPSPELPPSADLHPVAAQADVSITTAQNPTATNTPVESKPRIVIIRRKPEDLPEMPLPAQAEDTPTEQSAA